MKTITITLTVPDGVDVEVQRGAPVAVPSSAPQGNGDGPQCPDHHKAFKQNSRGWYCPTPTGENPDGSKTWCQRKPAGA